jgi:hypothetical protein
LGKGNPNNRFSRREELPGKIERAQREWDELGVEILQQKGLSKPEIKSVEQMLAKEDKAIQRRNAAYAGWLVTNRQFRAEVDSLRRTWEPVVRQRSGFPSYPHWPFMQSEEKDDEFVDLNEACFAFYLRWSLLQLVTWDWPVPIEPDLIGHTFRDKGELTKAGMLLFIPWYAMRSDQFNLQAIVRRARLELAPEHLAPWLRKEEQDQGKELGDRVYQRLLWLYRVYKLALEARYGQNCHGKMEDIDYAVSEVIGIGDQAITKLRQRLNRELTAA